jgi:hypothetical protein
MIHILVMESSKVKIGPNFMLKLILSLLLETTIIIFLLFIMSPFQESDELK